MNLTRAIDRRERTADKLGTVAVFILTALFVEFIITGVKIGRNGWDSFGTMLIVIASTFVLLPMLYVAAVFNRRRDALILLEIKRRLERPLAELFELEHAGQNVTIENYFAWREEYFRKAESTPMPAIDLWIGAVKRAELPGAHAYRRKFEKDAVHVDTAMSLILADY